MSCHRDLVSDVSGIRMVPVAEGSCGRISLGTTSLDLGMFGPLDLA